MSCPRILVFVSITRCVNDQFVRGVHGIVRSIERYFFGEYWSVSPCVW